MNKHRFPYKWTLQNAKFTKDKGTVFSCFSCGGGSTMGYKLAGFDVIGCNEIDERMMRVYKANHNPKYSFLGPIQDFKNKKDLPPELFNLDILDGSPPCSTFSTAGKRDKDWGKERVFKEGQKKQVLDTLFFDFIDLAKRLQPKIVIAENVKGILLGKAKEYTKKIHNEFENAGYYCQHFLLDASKMGVPQKRERVFFISIRKDLAVKLPFTQFLFDNKPILKLHFSEPEIPYKEIEDFNPENWTVENKAYATGRLWDITKPGQSFRAVAEKRTYFSHYKTGPNKPLNTISTKPYIYHYDIFRHLTDNELISGSAFPTDFNFLDQNKWFVCGMGVPPLMIAHVASAVYTQWLSKI